MIKSLRGMVQFNSVRTQLTFWFMIIALVPLVFVGTVVYENVENSRKASMIDKLEAVRDLKVKEVNNWLDERTGDLRTIASSRDIRKLEKVYKGAREDIELNRETIAEARDLLRRYLRNYDAFYELFIISPHTLKIMVSTHEEDEEQGFSKDPKAAGILNSSDLYIEDIYYSTKEERPSMSFSIPIYGLKNDTDVIGIIVARIDLERSLYELLLNRTGMGETGETLIVNKDTVALSELRWHKDAPLKMKLVAYPAVNASRAETGIVEARDYRGESVLAAYTYIPRTGWGFVAKQDIREIYAPVRQFRYLMLLAGVITVFGVLLIAYRTSRTISRPIEALHQGSEIIGSGNLDHKVGTDRQDEIGRLSRTFDRMIENIKLITASSNELNREIVWRKHLEKMVLEAEDRERRRIGHDLHDDLGQQLSGISFMSQCLENYLKENSISGAEKALRITQLIDRAKEQVKDLSMGLSPMILKGEEGFMTALAELAGNTSRVFNVPCGLRHDGPVSVRNEAAVIHLYRIAQEAVTNAVKHAAPRSVEIGISRRGNEIALTIRDDGTGISETGGSRRGMGLQVMNYRAGMIGASLDIRRHSSGGTLVTCIFPDTPEDPTESPEGNRTDESILQNI